jgi:hypothetical protein
MAARQAAIGKETDLRQPTITTAAGQLQPPARNIPERDPLPLQEALIHASQVKLLLRRAKAQETGFHKSECLNRLLQGLDRICASLEWLGGSGPRAEVMPPISAVDSDLVPAGGLQ